MRKNELENFIYRIKQEGLDDELARLKRILQQLNMKLIVFQDEEDGNPENKYFTAEIYLPRPDGLICITSSSSVDEVLRQIEEFINDYKTLNDIE